MKALINSVRLMGRLGMDPEVRIFDSDRKVAKASLATNEVYRNAAGEKATDTQWHSLIFWGHNADIAELYLKKGKEIAIEGRLATRNFTDKEGKRHFATEIIVNELLMIGKKDKEENESTPADGIDG